MIQWVYPLLIPMIQWVYRFIPYSLPGRVTKLGGAGAPSVIQVEGICIGRSEAPAQRIAPAVQGDHRPEDGGAVLGVFSTQENIGKPWENRRKTIGKPWENRKTMGKPWENHRKTIGKPWENHIGKTVPEFCWEN